MAELAIPLIGLGAMYIISNKDQDKKSKDGFSNMGAKNNSLPNINPSISPINYPNSIDDSHNNIKRYVNSNQVTDKYYRKEHVSKNVEINNPPNSVGGSTQVQMGLTGNPIVKSEFKHNNMVPFFGAKIKGSTGNHNQAESRLDHMQGSGSQHIRKKEQAPLFKPEKNLSWANGMPNMTDFFLSRQNPSQRMANVKPWDEKKVAPGLGLGYTTGGSGSGYNAGVENRQQWLPKNVDQLRTKTNPKISYNLNGHQGPAAYHIKDYAHLKNHGKIEKNRPDTDYELGPKRWFTTTGVEKAQTVRGIEVMQPQSRSETTAEYFGTAGQDAKVTYVPGNYKKSHKHHLRGPGLAAPSGKAGPSSGDYGNGSYQNYCNNRVTTEPTDRVGGVEGLVKAVIAPLMDILRPTRKENIVGNVRQYGNASSHVSDGHIYNPADKTRTTIREQTTGLLDNNHLNVQGQKQSQDAYLVSKHRAVSQERDSTNYEYGGVAAPAVSSATKSYAAEYNQRNNPKKTHVSRPSPGKMDTFNSNQNIHITKKDSDRVMNRSYATSARINTIPSVETYGGVNMSKMHKHETNDRINPDILKAFKENPYTKSLNSW